MTDLFDDIFFDGLKRSILGKKRPNKNDSNWLRTPSAPQDKMQIRNLIHTSGDSKKID